MANGCCAWAVSARRAAVGLPWDTSLVENRRLPSLSLASAASASTEAAGSLAIRSEAPTLKQATMAREVSLDVVFIVHSDLFTAATGIKTLEMAQRLRRGNSAAASERRARRSSAANIEGWFIKSNVDITVSAPARECLWS